MGRTLETRITRLALSALSVGLLLGGCGGCGGSGDGGNGEDQLNLLLISLDTLRADRLGCYGYDRDTSPALDAFAERSVRFRYAIAPSPWTVPSHVSLLTGLLPSTHGVHTSVQVPGDDTDLLAELLFPRGWYTFGITDGGNVSGSLGFDRGFRAFYDVDKSFSTTVREAQTYMADRQPFGAWFAFLHTYDIHCPYDPPEPYRSMFETEGAQSADIDGKCGNPWLNEMDLSPEQVQYISDRYDGGIREVDDTLAKLFKSLEESGAMENTVIVITSDHGEEFKEHGQIGHERSLHRELLEVPLIIYAPGLEPGVVDSPVSLVDVMPTVLELLGEAIPEGLDGRSLLPLIEGTAEPATGQPATLRWQLALDAWWTVDSQVIVNQQAKRVSYFDVTVDPLAQVDRAGEEREKAEARMADLRASLARGRKRQPGLRGSLSESEAATLRGLGYADAQAR
ncbi:MAG: arylsulfatase A-like enzyme [Planctomycetota bacterium]|jgi:arylsulfatase A-like enzyme